MSLINAIEHPNLDYNGSISKGRLTRQDWDFPLGPGQYACCAQADDRVILVRDPLGCNKLFYGPNERGDLVVSSRISRALELGVHLDDLASCPPGHVVQLSGRRLISVAGQDPPSHNDPGQAFDLVRFQRSVAGALARAMEYVRGRFPDALFAVCLSGGLDSSVVASLAKRWLGDVVAVSFSLLDEKDAMAHLKGVRPDELDSVSEDFSSATAVAGALGLPLFPVFRTAGGILDSVTSSVRLCQDWRDFNVHCAAVNLAIAKDIRALFQGRQVVVLTGDLMNELVCDYHEEEVDGTIYYPQPRVELGKRRRFLVRGLDAGDRELGVFGAFGLPVVQIFSAVALQYLGVPGEMLADANLKRTLNGHFLAPSVLDVVGAAKRRAQVGGSGKGILGIFHRAGIHREDLERIWVRSLPERMRGDRPLEIIQFGRYRAAPLRGDTACAE